MTDPERRLLELLKKRSFRRAEPGQMFRLASGEMSEYFIDGKMTAVSSEGAALIGEVLYDRTKDANLDAIGGLQVGAVPLTTAAVISYQQHGHPIEGFWVRDEVKSHGKREKKVLVVITALVSMSILYFIVQRTRMGTAMRAVSEDADAAVLMGIDVNRVVVFTFALGGAMAGIAGVCYAFVFKQVYFFMGFTPGIKAFGAAVLGGIGSVPGAMLGGLFLGIVESIGPALFLDGIGIPAPYQLRDLIAFTLLIMVLIFRPYGIMGERMAKKRA